MRRGLAEPERNQYFLGTVPTIEINLARDSCCENHEFYSVSPRKSNTGGHDNNKSQDPNLFARAANFDGDDAPRSILSSSSYSSSS